MKRGSVLDAPRPEKMNGSTISLEAPYIIGETSYNHQGDLAFLYQMIDDIAELELNAVKFHLLLNPGSYLAATHPLRAEIAQWLFTERQWDKIIDYSSGKGLDVIALCDDVESIDYVRAKSTVSAIELHASGLNDFYALNALRQWSGQIILGVGGSTIDEIQYAVDFFGNNRRSDVLLMYGFQAFPTNYQDLNLAKMEKLRDLFGTAMGYADHTSFDDPYNEFISVLPAAMGFGVLEKHYTPTPGIARVDYHAAIGKEQMLRTKRLLGFVWAARGTGEARLSPPELAYGNVGPMKKAIVAKRAIEKGETLSLENLWFKRSVKESSLRQNQLEHLIGLEAVRNIPQDKPIEFADVKYVYKRLALEDFTHTNDKR